MGAVQLSLIGGVSDLSLGDRHIDLPQGLTKRESVTARKLISKLWVNSEKTLKQSVTDLWHQKCHHYTSEALLIRNLSRRVMVDESVIRQWRGDLDLPCVASSRGSYRSMNLAIGDYVTEDDELSDPLQVVIDRTYLTQKQQAIWERYCRQEGILLPEEVNNADVRYVLNEAPISHQTLYAIFQQEPYAFCSYLDDCRLNIAQISRYGVKVPLRTLLTNNRRIRSIVIRYAQELYTNHGVPIPALAARLDIEPMELWRLGDLHGTWVLPSQQTLNHIIAQSVISHFA